MKQIGLLQIHEGHFSEAVDSLRSVIEMHSSGGVQASDRDGLAVLLGIAAVRQGEREPRRRGGPAASRCWSA